MKSSHSKKYPGRRERYFVKFWPTDKMYYAFPVFSEFQMLEQVKVLPNKINTVYGIFIWTQAAQQHNTKNLHQNNINYVQTSKMD